jgi:anti-anti-sigma regulatory factor
VTAVPFSVELHGTGSVLRLEVAGELDQAGVAEFETMFRWARTVQGSPELIVDVSGLTFCDSAGWHALEDFRAAGATISGHPPCLRRLLYLINRAHLLPPDLHELRGLRPEVARTMRTQIARARVTSIEDVDAYFRDRPVRSA